jgi:hypothetical protein
MSFNELNSIIFDDSDEPVAKTLTVRMPELPIEGLNWQFEQPESKHVKKSVEIYETYWNDIVAGQVPSTNTPLSKGDFKVEEALTKGGKAGQLVKRHMQRGESPAEAMEYALSLFEDKFSLEDQTRARKAIKALDLAAFLQLLSNAMSVGV